MFINTSDPERLRTELLGVLGIPLLLSECIILIILLDSSYITRNCIKIHLKGLNEQTSGATLFLFYVKKII